MKNKKLISASMFSGFLVLIALIVFNVDLLLRNNTNINNLLFDEVEALADGEFGNDSGIGYEARSYICSLPWNLMYAIVGGCEYDDSNTYCSFQESCPAPTIAQYCNAVGHVLAYPDSCHVYCQYEGCTYEKTTKTPCNVPWFKIRIPANMGEPTRTLL